MVAAATTTTTRRRDGGGGAGIPVRRRRRRPRRVTVPRRAVRPAAVVLVVAVAVGRRRTGRGVAAAGALGGVVRHDADRHPLAGLAVARRAADEVEVAVPVEAEPDVGAVVEPLHRLVGAAELVVGARHHHHRVVLGVLEICTLTHTHNAAIMSPPWTTNAMQQAICNGNGDRSIDLTEEIADVEAVPGGPVVVRLVGARRLAPTPRPVAADDEHAPRRRRRRPAGEDDAGGGDDGSREQQRCSGHGSNTTSVANCHRWTNTNTVGSAQRLDDWMIRRCRDLSGRGGRRDDYIGVDVRVRFRGCGRGGGGCRRWRASWRRGRREMRGRGRVTWSEAAIEMHGGTSGGGGGLVLQGSGVERGKTR